MNRMDKEYKNYVSILNEELLPAMELLASYVRVLAPGAEIRSFWVE